MSARASQKQLQITASNMTDAAACKMSGADLKQAADAAAGGVAVGPGYDGARLEQKKAGFA